MIDNLFLLAVGAFGWGLSLATYRMFARHYAWPMGALHADLPAIPILIGVVALMSGLLFAASRGIDSGGLMIVGCGFLLTVFWTGFLRVGSQISLFLAPLVTLLLLVGWLSVMFGFDRPGWAFKRPGDYFKRQSFEHGVMLDQHLRR